MPSFAKITVLGNLGQDPETSYTPNGLMMFKFSLAVNPRVRQGQPERAAVWYRVTAFGALAERLDTLAQQGYIAKGRTLQVSGDFDARPWTNNDGEVKISNDINAFDFAFVGGDRNDNQQGNGNGAQQQNRQQAPQRAATNGPAGGPPDDFSDVPF